MVDRYLGDVRTAVLDTVLLGKKPDLAAAAEAAGPRVFSYLKTELNTALIAYQRVAHFEAANEAGIDKFLYVGPLDRITRPFCQEHVGKVYTRDEIASLDNEQGLPVEVYGGGYNCRHHWRPVSDELARELQGG